MPNFILWGTFWTNDAVFYLISFIRFGFLRLIPRSIYDFCYLCIPRQSMGEGKFLLSSLHFRSWLATIESMENKKWIFYSILDVKPNLGLHVKQKPSVFLHRMGLALWVYQKVHNASIPSSAVRAMKIGLKNLLSLSKWISIAFIF